MVQTEKGRRAPSPFNPRYGRGTIGFGTAGERQVCSLRRELISPRYTIILSAEWMTVDHDRMPVLLQAKSFDGWLKGTLGPRRFAEGSQQVRGFYACANRERLTGKGKALPAKAVAGTQSVRRLYARAKPRCTHDLIASIHAIGPGVMLSQ